MFLVLVIVQLLPSAASAVPVHHAHRAVPRNQTAYARLGGKSIYSRYVGYIRPRGQRAVPTFIPVERRVGTVLFSRDMAEHPALQIPSDGLF